LIYVRTFDEGVKKTPLLLKVCDCFELIHVDIGSYVPGPGASLNKIQKVLIQLKN